MSELESKPVSELPGFLPSRLGGRDPFVDRLAGREEAQAMPIREGLPSHYRMRADAHYVDQLAGLPPGMTVYLLHVQTLESRQKGVVAPEALVKSIRRHGILQPLLVQRQGSRHWIIDGHQRLGAAHTAGLDRVPCVVHEVDDDEAAALTRAANERSRTGIAEPVASVPATPVVDGALAESLGALASAAALLSPSVASLSRRTAETLVRAEAWRASCLMDLARVLRDDGPAVAGSTSVGHVIDRAARHVAPEALLRGVDVEIRDLGVPAGAVVHGDEDLHVLALSGLLLSALELVDGEPSATVGLSASSRGGIVAVEVSGAVDAGPEWLARAFDPTWTNRPGGVASMVWIVGARRIAEAAGGQVAATSARGVTTLGLSLPLRDNR